MLSDSMPQTVPSGFSPVPEMNSFITEIDFSVLHDCEVPSPSQPGSWYYETSSPPTFHSPPYESSSGDLKAFPQENLARYLNSFSPEQNTYSSELCLDEDMEAEQSKLKQEQKINDYINFMGMSPEMYIPPSPNNVFQSPNQNDFSSNSLLGVHIKSEFPETTVNLNDFLEENTAVIKTENSCLSKPACGQLQETSEKQALQIQQNAQIQKQIYHIQQTTPHKQTYSIQQTSQPQKRTYQIQQPSPPQKQTYQIQQTPSHKQTYQIQQTPPPQKQTYESQQTPPQKPNYHTQQTSQPQKQSYQLLRSYLGDTRTFEKYPKNRPFDLSDVARLAGERNVKTEKSSILAEPCNEIAKQKLDQDGVINTFLEKMMHQEIGGVCQKIGIAPDPADWCVLDTGKWLVWACEYYRLPSVPVQLFSMDGKGLLEMGEEQFQRQMPQGGDKLYWSLYLWKAYFQENKTKQPPAPPPPPPSPPQTLDLFNLLGTFNDSSSPSPRSNTSPSDPDTSGEQTQSDDDEEMEEIQCSTSRTGSHIHLWQFLKELLSQAQVYGSCIRWMDPSKGIFKIEDSVRVARLWGKRKNRPAMNYDKLSRSIRQYYKKGIMKKTERSQRLVYQFCAPYHL